jgi:translation initiation factor 2B subunit (eIF-2B alpha/beta/delta family)
MPHLFMSQKTKLLRQLIRNTATQISSQNAVLTQCTFLKEVSSFILHLAIQHRHYIIQTKNTCFALFANDRGV